MHDQTGFYRDADGRIVSNGCACQYTPGRDKFNKRKPDVPIIVPGKWSSVGCPVHDPTAACAAAPRQPLRSAAKPTKLAG